MKRPLKYLLPLLLLLAGCAEKTQPTGVTLESPATLSISNEAQQFNVELTVPGGLGDLDILIPEDARDWLSNESSESATDGGKIILGFAAKASLLQEPREAVLTFSSKTYKDQVTVTVTQDAVGVLVNWAAEMYNNRLSPRWDNHGSSALSNEEGSAEVLIFPRDVSSGIHTIMGVEGELLLRFGNQLFQDDDSGKLFLVVKEKKHMVSDRFEMNKWYHIALTWKNGNVKVFINGEQMLSITDAEFTVNNAWSYEIHPYPRCWWFGYSCDRGRSFNGLMTEFRFWSKALTPDILNEPGHFYHVDVDKYKADLLCYWKMLDGSSWIIDNIVDNEWGDEGLTGEVNIIIDAMHQNRGEGSIVWKPVQLPLSAAPEAK